MGAMERRAALAMAGLSLSSELAEFDLLYWRHGAAFLCFVQLHFSFTISSTSLNNACYRAEQEGVAFISKSVAKSIARCRNTGPVYARPSLAFVS
jgi:hypothetical protein